jgi:hypothetical protein
MKQQTAVEWLHKLSKQRELDKFDWEQVKEMEKQQIVDAYKQGLHDWVVNDLSTSTILRKHK